jgi:putative transcriptional regulator
MSLRTLCLFAIVASVVAFAPIVAIGVQNRHSDSPGPNSWHGEALGPVLLPVQSKDPKDVRAGKLLVASRDLADPNFARTVVLLVHYDAQGVVGLVLNRRTDLPLSRVFAGLRGATDRSDPVYLGGPVETPAAFALLQSPTKVEGAERVFDGVYLISTKSLFEQTIAARPDQKLFHVYLGYAGWAPEQLRMEVGAGAWFIFQGDVRSVFNANPDSLWPQMIRKTEMTVAARRTVEAFR